MKSLLKKLPQHIIDRGARIQKEYLDAKDRKVKRKFKSFEG